MKFSTALITLSIAAFASAVPTPAGGPGEERHFQCQAAQDARANRNGFFNSGCQRLVDNCVSSSQGSADIWANKHCVAAAFCDGTSNLLELKNCSEVAAGNLAVSTTPAPSLNFNVWAGMVGQCAFNAGGSCPMTRQNFIDMVFSSMSEINVADGDWPQANDVIDHWWTPLEQWTATGETVPYLNLNDWLHFSQS